MGERETKPVDTRTDVHNDDRAFELPKSLRDKLIHKKDVEDKKYNEYFVEGDMIKKAGPMLVDRRRLAAIPLTDQSQPVKFGELPTDSVLILGVASTALVCIGCALKRKFRQLKDTLRRDSMGFLPISRRNSLTKADLSV